MSPLNHVFGDVFAAELREIFPGEGFEAHPDTSVAHVDRLSTDLAALCLSGTGLRSASFSLGVVQALARYGLLAQFHYLSTVSGGGYIGSWLTRWRMLQDDQSVFRGLNASFTTGSESPEVASLRTAEDPLAPPFELLSAASLTRAVVHCASVLLMAAMWVPLVGALLELPRTVLFLTMQLGAKVNHSALGISGLILLGLTPVFANWATRSSWRTNGLQSYIARLGPMCAAMSVLILTAVMTSHPQRAYTSIEGAAVVAGVYIAAAVLSACLYPLIQPRMAASSPVAAQSPRALLWEVGAAALAGCLVGCALADFLAWDRFFADTTDGQVFYLFTPAALLLAYFLGDVVYLAVAGIGRRDDLDHERFSQFSVWFAVAGVSWAFITAIVLFGPQLISQWPIPSVATLVVSAASCILLGNGGWMSATSTGEKDVAKEARDTLQEITPKGITGAIFSIAQMANLEITPARIAILSSIVFSVTLATFIALALQVIAQNLGTLSYGGLVLAADPALFGGLMVGALLVSCALNTNRLSMHARVRARLARIFLGAARGLTRQPSPITGFDPTDDQPLAKNAPRTTPSRLFHVINATLNVSDLQGRRTAEPFALTRLFCGGSRTGFVATPQFGEGVGGITLGNAMTISGASHSPDRGYSSSPLVDFLLTLFGLRLGYWAGNPSVSTRQRPLLAALPELQKLLALNRDTSQFQFLSDGAHFDPLGLYEMIRRRCRFIVVVDATWDPHGTWDALGQIVRTVHIDFGVSIDFKKLDIPTREGNADSDCKCCKCCECDESKPKFRHAVGQIHYPGAERSGTILYLKPTYIGDGEPVDVLNYAKRHPAFPHEVEAKLGTGQFEAYRRLGEWTMSTLCGSQKSGNDTPARLSLHNLWEQAMSVLTDPDETDEGPQAA